MMDTYIFPFHKGDKSKKELLGGKGANLAEMTKLGLPVPPGFTITTAYCNYYLEHQSHEENFRNHLKKAVSQLEEAMGKTFGSPRNPLLVSVRSGARASMPGMMDTVLNLGLNPETVEGLAKLTGNETFAYDSYRRFMNMFGDVVMGVDHEHFEEALSKVKGSRSDQDLSAEDWKEVVSRYASVYRESTGEDFPTDPMEQLNKAILAVFKSWNNKRAVTYRRLNRIPDSWGTAVNVQAMVFGNMGDDSGTGVAFTRDPSTGERRYYGEFLFNAQGEDVVAGIRNPLHLDDLKKRLPEIYKELVEIFEKLERHYADMQDIEFTIERGKLFILQTRNGKRTGRAAVKIAVDMVDEKLIDEKNAVLRVSPESLDQLLHPSIDPKADKTVIAKGLPASPGAVSGSIVFTADDAVEWVRNGKKVILVRRETSPEDIAGMDAAEGILTAVGGMTSHAAVVARGMGKSCVAGAKGIEVSAKQKTMLAQGKTYHEGDIITLSGSTGEVMEGEVPTVPPATDENFETLMKWSDNYRNVQVRTNAETPQDCRQARAFGAEGIGLCRTEHMFFNTERIRFVRQMIIAEKLQDRIRAIDQLLPYQQSDFEEIFRIMNGYPVTVRLLDPPLHEFIPHEEEQQKEIAADLDISLALLQKRLEQLSEVNPMLGHRGVRLAISYPELPVMQAKAIIQAALRVQKEGVTVIPEIMIPLVALESELSELARLVKKHADKLIAESDQTLDYTVGTMIEVPRACMVADAIAAHADFFSFGTNDLTQMGFGISRDDGGKFIPEYIERGILKEDPFQHLDQAGIGGLIQLAIEKGRSAKKSLKIGICGEHGGDPSSIAFGIKSGFNYVSCSPFRVPIARLSAAQTAITVSG